ncbi:MAG: CpsD/CapB family tyrosine-protein kinase [Candidatus Omnitrophica bacterium]|nr:CpsD/CapB family tyrosine-protein kinase [Candidatus Omnitrophota bacterium]
MGKITNALKKAAEERLQKIEKFEEKAGMKFEFVVKKRLDSKIDPRIVSLHEPSSSVAEQYKKLRTNIQAIDSKYPIKAITITSSTHGEGKTITAINLAISMAHDLHNKKIILVDADMRRGRISKYLGFKEEVGLSDLLSNGANVDDALVDIGIANLTVLPSGKSPHNPAELLGSPQSKNFIKVLKSKYDYIIFDAPPIIPVTDAGLLGAQTDGVIMVVQTNRTQKGVLKHGEGLLRQAQAKILGYILTNLQYHIPGYLYRYL